MKVPQQFLALSVISLALVATPLIHADVVSGNSQGYGLGIVLDAGTGATLDLPLLPPVTAGATVNISPAFLPSTASGTAPAAYDTGVVSSIQVNTSLASVAGLSAGAIAANVNLAGTSGTFNGRALSTVDGLTGSKQAQGIGSVENLSLNLSQLSLTSSLTPIFSMNLVSFAQGANTTLQSTSTVTGDYSAFTRTGTSVIANLGISINGGATASLSSFLAPGSFDLDGQGNIINVAPNTQVAFASAALSAGLPAGVSLGAGTTLVLTLNKQDLSGDINVNPMIQTTALEIDLNNLDVDVGLAGVADLDVDGGLTIALGYSQAQLVGVPEPSTVALLGLGALGLAWKVSRHRKA